MALPIPFARYTTYSGHSGVDFPYPFGTAIRASGPGRVSYRGWLNNRAGYSVQVAYDGGPTVLYCHMPNLNSVPGVGARVGEGTVIGTVGSTGNSTGPHLHMEIMVGRGAHTYAGVWNHFTASRVVGSGGSGGSSNDTKNRQSWLNRSRGEKLAVDGIEGPATKAAYKRYQSFLKSSYGYTGAIDGIWGAGTQASHQRFYNAFNSNQKLAVDGKLGPATIKKLQKVLGVTQDGQWGRDTSHALQRKLVAVGYKIAVDGDFGPASIRALQTFLLGHKKADGIMGPETIRGLQTYLNGGGVFAPPKKPTPPASTKLTVDGKMGALTIKALQKLLGVAQDGKIGPITTRALQKALGVTEDGQWGVITTKALQRSLGVTADGEIGPITIKALQTHLNSGKAFTKPAPEKEEPKPEVPSGLPRPGTKHFPFTKEAWETALSFSPRSRKQGDRLTFAIHHTANPNPHLELYKRGTHYSVPNSLVTPDGSFYEIVRPANQSIATALANSSTYSVEVENTTGGPEWKVSDASIETLARIAAYLKHASTLPVGLDGMRYEFEIDAEHIKPHNSYPGNSTACPGPYLTPLIPSIIERAKAIYKESYGPKGTPILMKAQAAIEAAHELFGSPTEDSITGDYFIESTENPTPKETPMSYTNPTEAPTVPTASADALPSIFFTPKVRGYLYATGFIGGVAYSAVTAGLWTSAQVGLIDANAGALAVATVAGAVWNVIAAALFAVAKANTPSQLTEGE